MRKGLFGALINEFPELRKAIDQAIDDGWERTRNSWRAMELQLELCSSKWSNRLAWKQNVIEQNRRRFPAIVIAPAIIRYERQLIGARFAVGGSKK